MPWTATIVEVQPTVALMTLVMIDFSNGSRTFQTNMMITDTATPAEAQAQIKEFFAALKAHYQNVILQKPYEGASFPAE